VVHSDILNALCAYPLSNCNRAFAPALKVTASVCARYARCRWGRLGLKVAIVDFDIHQGNGTQEMVESLVCAKGNATLARVTQARDEQKGSPVPSAVANRQDAVMS